MAPMRGERGGSPARGARASLPLPRKLMRQMAQAHDVRPLRRIDAAGCIVNYDNMESYSDYTEHDGPQPAIACDGNAGNLPPTDHDDDLTSLSWLQDRNLLRGINFSKTEPKETKFKDSKSKMDTSPTTVTETPSPPSTPIKLPFNSAHVKPPYSFSCLIFMAIEAAPARALPVKEIYAWIVKNFPYFKHAPQGWKNSVRHNLSLNKCFFKVAAAPGVGKGSLWTVDPQHRDSLLQAFGRQGIPTCGECRSPSKPLNHNDVSDSQLDASETKSCSVQSNRTGNENENNGDANSSDAVCNNPDPNLFPRLSRRLVPRLSPPGADEYIAAATVLTMKYGHSVINQLPPEAHVVISRCARDEHSYSTAGEERRTAEALLYLAGLTS